MKQQFPKLKKIVSSKKFILGFLLFIGVVICLSAFIFIVKKNQAEEKIRQLPSNQKVVNGAHEKARGNVNNPADIPVNRT